MKIIMETYIAKEGRETFEFQAKNLDEAMEACEMWNATLIKKVENNY
jgi:hypothetical protein